MLLKKENKKMKKIVPIKKMSKKVQKEYYSRKRGSWNGVVPTTKIVKSKKVYDRKKFKKNLAC